MKNILKIMFVGVVVCSTVSIEAAFLQAMRARVSDVTGFMKVSLARVMCSLKGGDITGTHFSDRVEVIYPNGRKEVASTKPHTKSYFTPEQLRIKETQEERITKAIQEINNHFGWMGTFTPRFGIYLKTDDRLIDHDYMAFKQEQPHIKRQLFIQQWMAGEFEKYATGLEKIRKS